MATAAACILWFSIIMYSVLGGADYGAGFWDLLAGGSKRGERPRGLIDHAMAPVWEANNVWLIFAAIVCWTAFSQAFGSIMKTLFIPIILAGIGIVVRGSGFAFRKIAQKAGRKRVLSAAFGISSRVTPFMLGAALGGIASGRVPPGNEQGELWSSWLNSTSLVVGIFGVLISAFVAATFLIADANRYYDDVMAGYFGARACVIGILAGLTAVVGLFVLRDDSPYIHHGLTHEGLPFVIASAVFGLTALGALWRQFGGVRVRTLAAATVVSVLLGWGVAQYPYILPTTLTIDEAAAPGSVLSWLVIVVIIGAAGVPGWAGDRRAVPAPGPRGGRWGTPTAAPTVAAGGRPSSFGNDQSEPFAPGMKTIDDALELRRRIFGAFELAEIEADPEEKRRWLTFVVVGAGPTGCEPAGQIAELAERSVHHNFPATDQSTA